MALDTGLRMANEHGEYRFEWQGDLLIFTLSGGFNEAAIANFFQQVIQSLAQREFKPWVLLSDIDQNVMGTPEVHKAVKMGYKWAGHHGCCAAAISDPNLIIRHVYHDFFNQLPYDADIFTDRDQAIVWLNARLS